MVVGPVSELASEGAEISDVNWIEGTPPNKPVRARVQVRHRHPGVDATLYPLPAGVVRAEFDEPVDAVSPGQAAVFYDPESREDERGERVLGGGWIRA